jgi:dynein heavy chain 2
MYYAPYSSDEDTDVKALVSSWLSKQEERARDMLSGWIEDSFYKALEWVLRMVSYLSIFIN